MGISYEEALRPPQRKSLSYEEAMRPPGPPPEADIAAMHMPEGIAGPEVGLSPEAAAIMGRTPSTEQLSAGEIPGELFEPFHAFPRTELGPKEDRLLKTMGKAELAALGPAGAALAMFGPKRAAEEVAAGSANVATDILEGIESPAGVATLGAGGVTGALIKTAAQKAAATQLGKLIGAGFGLTMTKPAAEKIGTASATGSLKDIIEAGGTTGMAVLPMLPGIKMAREYGRTKPITTGDQLRLFNKQIEEMPLIQARPLPDQRQLGYRNYTLDPNVLLDPAARPLVEKALAEGQPGHVAVPGEVPAMEQLRALKESPQIGETIQNAPPILKNPPLGLEIAAQSAAKAKAIPSARQAAVEELSRKVEAESSQPLTGGLVDQINKVIFEKDRLTLEDMRREIAGADKPDVFVEKLKRDNPKEFQRLQNAADALPEIEAEINALRVEATRKESILSPTEAKARSKVLREYPVKLAKLQQRLKLVQDAKAQLQRTEAAPPQQPGVGTRSQANDLLRVIDQRLEELKSGREHNENKALRRIIQPPKPKAPAEKGPLPEVRVSPPNQKLIGFEVTDPETGAKFQRTRTASGRAAKKFTQTAGGARVGDVQAPGMPEVVKGMKSEVTEGLDPTYTVTEITEVVGPNEVKVKVRDMTPDEIYAKRHELKVENEARRERGEPPIPVPDATPKPKPAAPEAPREGVAEEITGTIIELERDPEVTGRQLVENADGSVTHQPVAQNPAKLKRLENLKALRERISKIPPSEPPAAAPVEKPPVKPKPGPKAKAKKPGPNPAYKVLPRGGIIDFEHLENPELGLRHPPAGTRFRAPEGGLPKGTLIKSFGKGVGGTYPLMMAFTPDGRVYVARARANVLGTPGSLWGLEYVTKWFKEEPAAPGAPPAKPYFHREGEVSMMGGETPPTVESIRAQRALEERRANAIQPETAQPVRPVREEPGKGAGQVSQPEGVTPPDVGRGEAQANVPKEIADNLGIRFESEMMGRWMFTAFDKAGKESTTFVTKAGATPAEISAKYEVVRKAYGDEPNAPRPLKEAQAAPQPDWVVMVQGKQGDVPGWVQIEDPRATESSGSLSVKSLREAGHDVPDFSQLPSGRYTYAEAVAKAKAPLNPGGALKDLPADLQARSNAVQEQMRAEFERLKREAQPPEPTVEAVTPLDPASGAPLSATDALINKLEALKFATDKQGRIINPKGQMFSLPHPDAIKAIGQGVWNDAVDVAIAAIKAGRAIGEAINEAINYVKYNAKGGFNEGELRANFDYLIRHEIPSAGPPIPPTRAPTPPPAGGGTPPPAGGAPAPAPGGPTPPPPRAPGGRAPRARNAGLSDIYARFEPPPKAPLFPRIKATIRGVREGVRTGFSSLYRPLDKLAEDIYESVRLRGGAMAGRGVKRLAHIFETLKGSSGKAEADVFRFDRAVTDLVGDDVKDFNAYMFLRRSLDRLRMDQRDINRAIAGQPVKRLNRRAVDDYIIPELEAKLQTLMNKLNARQRVRFQDAALRYQQHMDQALQLQVQSGRMSPEVYTAIKSGNQFYAPFKIQKYLLESSRPEGSGIKVDTVADFTKAMTGIEDPNFKVGDMLAAGRQNIAMSRVLAEKNLAMQKFAEVADMDTMNLFTRKLNPGEKAPFRMEAVNVLRNGKIERYAVPKPVADAVHLFNRRSNEAVSLFMRGAAMLFRAGATTANVPFQAVNLLLADAPRAAFVSKYGVGGPSAPFGLRFTKELAIDTIRYPMNFIQSMFSAMEGNLGAVSALTGPIREGLSRATGKNLREHKLYLDYLDSGAAGAVIQDYLTPGGLQYKPLTKRNLPSRIARGVLRTIPEFAKAIEETHKVLGIKRAMLFEGATSGKDLAARIPEAVTEVRRFSGSPDFARMGKWTESARLNLVFMFLNARIQGAVADVGRFTGRDGAKRAAASWVRLGTAVGIPTAALWYYNHLPQYRADYESRPKNERDNYFLIPKETYVTDDKGHKMRDFWRIPKRESVQIMANLIESALQFSEKKDPQAFASFGVDVLENLSPLNIRGEGIQERLESTTSSLNPVFKAPIEFGTGRDTFRHRQLVPDTMKKASPEEQYLDRTPVLYRKLAKLMPDVFWDSLRSPIMLENLTQNMTANLISQFLPSRPIKGREGFESFPLLRRFQAATYSDDTNERKIVERYQRDAANEFLERDRAARAAVLSSETPEQIARMIADKYGTEKNAEKIFERAFDLWLAEKNGITRQERAIIALPIEQRAQYIMEKLQPLNPDQKIQLLMDYERKRILTDDVLDAMTEHIPDPQE